MNEAIQESKARIADALAKQQYQEALNIYSGLIDVSIHQLNETNGASSLLSDRAGVFLLAKDYPKALADANKAIDLDRTAVYGYIHKAKALYHLGEYDEARKVIKTARELLGANPLIDECELYTAKSWLTLGE